MGWLPCPPQGDVCGRLRVILNGGEGAWKGPVREAGVPVGSCLRDLNQGAGQPFRRQSKTTSPPHRGSLVPTVDGDTVGFAFLGGRMRIACRRSWGRLSASLGGLPVGGGFPRVSEVRAGPFGEHLLRTEPWAEKPCPSVASNSRDDPNRETLSLKCSARSQRERTGSHPLPDSKGPAYHRTTH